jgi:hypothetical protein
MICYLADAAILVTGNKVTCNGQTEQDFVPPLMITGTGTSDLAIQIDHAAVHVIFQDVSSPEPVTVSGSTAAFTFKGVNQLGGVFCGDLSNLTVLADDHGRLLTDGNSEPGLGARQDEFCSSLVLVNGSVVSRGGFAASGIGTGMRESRIVQLTLMGGNVAGHSSVAYEYGGAGIGTGYSWNGMNTGILDLRIMGGTVYGNSTSDAGGASGIGTGCAWRGNSRIAKLTILNGNVIGSSASSHDGGAGIGTGHCRDADGGSGIEELTILDGNVTGISANNAFGGSGIGTGSTESGNSGIGSLTIHDGNVTGSTRSSDFGGSGIGTGHARYGGSSRIDRLTILNGRVIGRNTITGEMSSGGSGLGTGSAIGQNSNSEIGSLTILNGTMTSYSWGHYWHGPDNLTGYSDQGSSKIGHIYLRENYTVFCNGSEASRTCYFLDQDLVSPLANETVEEPSATGSNWWAFVFMLVLGLSLCYFCKQFSFTVHYAIIVFEWFMKIMTLVYAVAASKVGGKTLVHVKWGVAVTGWKLFTMWMVDQIDWKFRGRLLLHGRYQQFLTEVGVPAAVRKRAMALMGKEKAFRSLKTHDTKILSKRRLDWTSWASKIGWAATIANWVLSAIIDTWIPSNFIASSLLVGKVIGMLRGIAIATGIQMACDLVKGFLARDYHHDFEPSEDSVPGTDSEYSPDVSA